MQKSVYKLRILKGDTVMIRSGKHKGKVGKVLATHPKDNKVTVEGINVVKKSMKPTQQRPQGGIVEINKPLHVSKVGVLDSAKKKPSRIGFKMNAEGKKIRVLKSSGKELK